MTLLYSQTLLTPVKPTIMSTRIIQVLAVPLIIVDIVFPIMFMDISESKLKCSF
jgi:hypothetical protein